MSTRTHYHVTDTEFNRTHYPHSIGKVYYPDAPSYAQVSPVTVEIKPGHHIRTWGGWYQHDQVIVNGSIAGFVQTKRQNKRTEIMSCDNGRACVLGYDVAWIVRTHLNATVYA